ncbi:MAG: tetratricopeptide repeat protein [Pirellulales bacterium]|nr:tetratricopeptide repeat protein [Pirellulales bacterium]
MASQSSWIIETTRDDFEADVLERSRTVPVVVDFWAPWCQPCRMLGPILERLAEEHQGQFVLVKANTDELPDIAASFGVQSIPAVFAVREAALVDQFVGVLPELQLRAWVKRILPSEAETLASEAAELERTDPKAAEARYRQALQERPNDIAARVGLARTLLAQAVIQEARQIIDELAAAGALDAEGQRVQAEIRVRLEAEETGSPEQARAAAEADPKNLELQWNLARALVAAAQHEEAMQICLRLVERDRHGLGEQARVLMVDIFRLLGPESDLANEYRRRLSMALF